MALPPTDKTDEAFLREVDEELRRDQAVQLWKRWGRWIIGVIVLGLAIFALVLYLNYRSQRIAEKQGEQYDAAIQAAGKGQTAKGSDELKKLETSGGPGYRAMAAISAAEILVSKNDLKGGAAKYAAIAADSSVDQAFRDLALIRQTSAEFDTIKPEAVVERLKGLATPSSAYFGSAGELVAAAYLKLGKRDLAGKLYGQIGQTEGVPDSIRQRAVQMAGVLNPGAIDQSGEKKTK